MWCYLNKIQANLLSTWHSDGQRKALLPPTEEHLELLQSSQMSSYMRRETCKSLIKIGIERGWFLKPSTIPLHPEAARNRLHRLLNRMAKSSVECFAVHVAFPFVCSIVFMFLILLLILRNTDVCYQSLFRGAGTVLIKCMKGIQFTSRCAYHRDTKAKRRQTEINSMSFNEFTLLWGLEGLGWLPQASMTSTATRRKKLKIRVCVFVCVLSRWGPLEHHRKAFSGLTKDLPSHLNEWLQQNSFKGNAGTTGARQKEGAAPGSRNRYILLGLVPWTGVTTTFTLLLRILYFLLSASKTRASSGTDRFGLFCLQFFIYFPLI